MGGVKRRPSVDAKTFEKIGIEVECLSPGSLKRKRDRGGAK